MKRLYQVMIIMMLLLFTTTVFANTVTLYSEPKTDSKVAGTLNTENGVTIVYTPKDNEWIKVANPTNGEVGWAKSKDLGSNGTNLRVVASGNDGHSYKIYQFGSGNSLLKPEQIENEIRYFEQQQRMMQIHMAQLFNEMFYFPQPFFVPVVMVPDQAKSKTLSSKEPSHIQKVQEIKNKS